MYIKNQNDIHYVDTKFMDLKYKLIRKNSKSEDHFEKLMIESGLYFIREKCNFKIETRWCYYDFYIPRLRLYVEIDGEEHNLPEKKFIDRQKESYVKKNHRFIIRIKNKDCLSMNKVNIHILRGLIFKTMSKKKYFDSLVTSRKIQEEGLKNVYDDDFLNQEIYLYSHMSGLYYHYDNVVQCCAYTSFKPRYIKELLETEYKKSGTRLYVIGSTLSECEKNVAIVFN